MYYGVRTMQLMEWKSCQSLDIQWPVCQSETHLGCERCCEQIRDV